MAWLKDGVRPETAHEARVMAMDLMDDAVTVPAGDHGLRMEVLTCAQVCASLAVSMQMAEDRRLL